MKFTINGFGQKRLVELGLDNDDSLILRYFIDFKETDEMTKVDIDGISYYWINYNSVINEMPILSIKKDSLYRRLKKLVAKGVLVHTTLYRKNGVKGTFSFYALGKNYLSLIKDDSKTDNSEKNPTTPEEAKKNENIPGATDENPKGYGNKSVEGTEINPEGVRIKIPTKDSSINNPSTKEIDIKKYIKKDVEEVVDYLNKKINANYRPNSKSTIKVIEARLSENYIVDDFRVVIDKKAKEWLGTNMERYLTPQTLFGNKFEQYLNQKIVNEQAKSNGNNYDGGINPMKFNNFEARDYDYDSLEKKLLGWDK